MSQRGLGHACRRDPRAVIHRWAEAGNAQDLYLTLGYNSVVPPHVRQAMLSRTLTHDGLLERLTTPVLMVHGSDDEIVLPAMSEHHARLIPHAKTSWYQGIGHTPFREDPDRFNADLRAFASSL